jgi:hypothetical protein
MAAGTEVQESVNMAIIALVSISQRRSFRIGILLKIGENNNESIRYYYLVEPEIYLEFKYISGS